MFRKVPIHRKKKFPVGYKRTPKETKSLPNVERNVKTPKNVKRTNNYSKEHQKTRKQVKYYFSVPKNQHFVL